MQTNLGTKSVCNLVTKRSNGFGYTNLDHSRSHKIEKNEKNGFGPFTYKFFVPVRVGLIRYLQLVSHNLPHVFLCDFFPFILDINGVTQEESHTQFFIHLPSAVRALIFFARRIQPFLSLVDREVEFDLIVLHSLGNFFFLERKIPFAGIDLTCQRVRRLRGYP